MLTLFFDTCQDRRWDREGLLIWKELARVTKELADFAAVDGLKEYSSLTNALDTP